MKIIVVDDEELAQKRLLRMLRELGFEDVEVAKDGYEALELIKTTHFDVIFLDINMPYMNGLELGRKIKALLKDKAVIYQTAYSSHALDAFDIGAIGYLVKPYSTQQLKESLERVQTKEQEYRAKEKLDAGIINDLHPDTCSVFQKAADVLSGDFYSIYKLKNGAVFLSLFDAQGHGISPALTVFAVSSVLNKFVYEMDSLQEIIDRASPMLQTFLGEIEQLSYTMIMVHKDKKTLSYASGGMYPFLIKIGDELLRVKANNLPFMNFSEPPKVETLDVAGWESLLLYSDGILEHENSAIEEFTPQRMLKNPKRVKEIFETLQNHNFEDDVTILYMQNLG